MGFYSAPLQSGLGRFGILLKTKMPIHVSRVRPYEQCSGPAFSLPDKPSNFRIGVSAFHPFRDETPHETRTDVCIYIPFHGNPNEIEG